ncbi:FERM, ARHGEF and pleckstrin domain-containing protein 1 [Caerostris darwini]|uniref:Moesin/ezrin/radixin homolog 1 n=1 Tax=Caerostris darwini TaxID=1538125 RepID=A0AAV4SV50_9ARAC|nr:FERM, ARHGEF and pleckstrin domain-containing protein 1 [Caerostris darwini]
MSSPTSDSQETKVASSHRSRKFINVTVYFLDDSSHVFQLQAKSLGQALFEKVCKFINVLEVDYFGLEFEDDKKIKCWLDALKPLCSQVTTSFPTMYFCVKFYTPDPVQLEDEFTRYLFGLQVKKDIANGQLQCNDNTSAVMISYIVQADFGDFNPEKCSDGSYLSGFKFVPFQDAELERKIMENHKKIMGQTPAEADLNLLETARRCELYGVKMTAAKDHEGVPLNLAVAHLGVIVFQNFTKINTFSWAKIRKLSFKRKKFLIKLHPEGYGYYKDTVEFFFEGRNECKNFWKKCIENHTFFRCTDAKQGMRQKPKIFSRGSSFRYSGRTQKQVSEFVRENCFKRQPFQRSTSLRTPSSPSRSIGTSISPQPLLPVTSLSCGSISDISKEAIPPQKILSTSEPTTPHVAAELHNSISENCSRLPDTPVSGPVSPDGDYGHEYYSQDTDDNISHDSYNVLDKESATKTNTECLPTNIANTSNSKDQDMESSATKNDGGKSNDEYEDDDYRRKSRRHRVRVFSNHISIEQTSPILYARANRHLSIDRPETLCKAYPRTVDFVYVNQLPAVGSFSYRDDSVELKSPGKLKLEMLRQKLKDEDFSSCIVNGSDFRARSKSQPLLPLGVDLLNDLVHVNNLSQKPSCSRDFNHKESAMKVIADNLDVKNKPSIIQNADVLPSTSNQVTSLPPDCIPKKESEISMGKAAFIPPKTALSPTAYQNFYHMVYLDMMRGTDSVDRSDQYSYNTYKFSHIGRPPDLPLKGSTSEETYKLQSNVRDKS